MLLSPLFATLALGCASGSCGTSPATPAPVHFDADRAWRDLETLVSFGPRPIGTEALERTRAFIEAELAKVGYVVKREAFTANTPKGQFEMANVYADLPGKSDDVVLLVSHFDTKLFDFEFVGANDGASGTAVLLELARSMMMSGPRAVTYRFLFVDGEEATRDFWGDKDHTYGSRHHAQQLVQRGVAERFKACVLLDLVGDKDLHLLDEIYSDADLKRIFRDAARANGLGKYMDGRRQEAKDDHLEFMRVGIPSIDLIDFDYGPNNDYWHTAEDTIDKCSKASLDAIGRIVLHGLHGLEQFALDH